MNKKKQILTLTLLLTLSVSLFSLTGFGDSPDVALDETLPVQLSSFTALQTYAGFVQLQWTSETETNMLGYNVYRANASRLADADMVNRTLIPAHNTSTTTNYSFIDEDVMFGTTHYYWLQSLDLDLTNEFYGPLSVTIEAEENGKVPEVFVTALKNNYPNPFNPNTTIEYSIREETEISLRIFNIQGQLVKTLAEGKLAEGNYSVNWNGTDDNGKEVGSGIYFYRLSTDHYDNVYKMLLVK